MALEDGADDRLIERVTHTPGKKRRAFDRYDRADCWATARRSGPNTLGWTTPDNQMYYSPYEDKPTCRAGCAGPARIHALATARRVSFTLKARRELSELGDGLDEEDACQLLATLTAQESAGRLKSRATGEWMYIFKPALDDKLLYVKILRTDCIVVSFHEDLAEP
jgi:hypothetical protein